MHIPSLILAFVLDFLGQILTEDVCCPIRNNMSIDLTEGVFKGNILGTIQPTFGSSPSTNMECGTPAHLTMDFDNFSNSMSFWKQDQCISSPTCGQRMLRVDMFLGKQRSGCMFHVGDSLGNDDLGTERPKYNAYILGYYPNIVSSKSDHCKTETTEWMNTLLAPDVKRLTVFVANNYFRIQNDQGFDVEECHRCGFALNGQDPDDRYNTLYMAFNDDIQGKHSNAYGVCHVKIHWVCPDC